MTAIPRAAESATASVNGNDRSMTGSDGIGECALMLGSPPCRGRIRDTAADFRVTERLGFTPPGTGAHFWLRIEKTLLNTLDVVHLLARSTAVAARDIGISGQKDRNAVTSQWFSVPVGDQPGIREEQIRHCCSLAKEIRLEQLTRNRGKLKHGSHRRNDFVIAIRGLEGDAVDIAHRAERIRVAGFPNYFGPQRFGRGGRNLETATRLFRGEIRRIDRIAQSMALSSARSWIFNQVLSARLHRFAIDFVQIGDALQLDGSNSFFIHDGTDQSVVDRITAGDLHPTGPLWGGGAAVTGETVAAFEAGIAMRSPVFSDGLVAAGMKHQRRALRVIPPGIEIDCQGDAVILSFSLPAGAFATSLLRELVVI